ncbi:DUF5050 domain-containing protein [Virgibacillus oceani]
MRIGIYTVVIITFLLLLGGCNHPEVEIDPPYDTGNNPINNRQFGFVAEDKDWFYYIDGENNHNITRTNGNVKETYENTYARGLNLYGDYIYFASHSSDFEGSSGFYRVHKDDPQDIEKVHSQHTNDPIIVNDYIFYSIFSTDDRVKSGLYRSKTDGSEQVQLDEGTINGLQWSDGWLYYAVSSGGSVYRMQPSGEGKVKLKTKDNIPISTTNILIIDDWIYFESNDDQFNIRYGEGRSPSIFRLSLVNDNVEKLAVGSLHNIEGTTGYVYFSKPSHKESGLFKMNLDGSNQTEIYRGEKSWSWINIIDDDVYLLDWGAGDPTHLYRYTPDEQDSILTPVQ